MFKALILAIVVLSYNPAPGQFINTLPLVADTASAEAAAQRNLDRGSMVCLGAWGGYIDVRLSEPLVNSHDYDLMVFGNSHSGSSEPGIIYVSRDENQNGLADDTWYEIRGSEYDRTEHNYSITYYRPAADALDIRYRDSHGLEDSVLRNTFHAQPYYPAWITADSITFRGALLPCNAVDTTPGLTNFVIYDYGYADNRPNNDTIGCSIKLDWAVDAAGAPADLEQIDFVSVQNSVLYTNNRRIGESSTEVSGICPIIREPVGTDNVEAEPVAVVATRDELIFGRPVEGQTELYTITGIRIARIPEGTLRFCLSSLPGPGCYIVRTGGYCYKFMH